MCVPRRWLRSVDRLGSVENREAGVLHRTWKTVIGVDSVAQTAAEPAQGSSYSVGGPWAVLS